MAVWSVPAWIGVCVLNYWCLIGSRCTPDVLTHMHVCTHKCAFQAYMAGSVHSLTNIHVPATCYITVVHDINWDAQDAWPSVPQFMSCN